MTFNPPENLIKAQQAFFAAEQRCEELSAKMPAPSAIAAQEAEISDEQRAELDAAREERHKAVAALQNDPWWKTLDPSDMNAAQIHLRKAAAQA